MNKPMLEHMLGHYGNALKSYNEQIMHQPTQELYYCRALIYIEQANYPAAIDDLNKCNNSPFAEEVLFKRGLSKFYMG